MPLRMLPLASDTSPIILGTFWSTSGRPLSFLYSMKSTGSPSAKGCVRNGRLVKTLVYLHPLVYHVTSGFSSKSTMKGKHFELVQDIETATALQLNFNGKCLQCARLLYSGALVHKLNLFPSFEKDGYICVCMGKMATVVFVTRNRVLQTKTRFCQMFLFANWIVNQGSLCEWKHPCFTEASCNGHYS